MIMMSDDGPVAIVTFENPPMGYMNLEMVKELDRIVAAHETDDNVRAIVFTGGLPNVFIRHYDVAEIVAAGDFVQSTGRSVDDIVASAKAETDISNLFNRVDQCAKPTIAAINGMCMGGGYEFALCCDIRLAGAGDYTIGLPETNVGIFPGAGGTQRLPRVVGEARALEMILCGRVADPREAAELGLVHEHISGDVLAAAVALGKELAQKTPRSLAAAKQLVKGATQFPLAEGLANERAEFMRLLADDEEAMQRMRDFVSGGGEIA
ncbi:enoyl-CoA hydratase/isomerase family protein [Pyruvatibacter sp.]|uniref:enoyl-CoA hydratase/isomerase family protein n=1 Tax=Pyruvatibacter sp. TaxID=1981328 RepID=UPI0032EE9EE8